MNYYSAFPSWFLFINVFLSSFSSAPPASTHEGFLQCLSHHISNNSTSIAKLIYTEQDPSYFSVLNSSIQNSRFSSRSTRKPLVIVTPFHASQVQFTVTCSKKYGLQIRTRSGGHDFEGLSYVSEVPFIIIDLRHLSSITVNIDEKTAWVEAGATIGEVYYRIAEKSENLSFPAGFCPTAGVGGHFSGGGYGALMRKYGLAADNIVDAHLVNVDGRILDRKSMGVDLFWAIRAGGAASFGVVLSWKIKLVHVPSKVTIYNLDMNSEKNETKKLVNRWQYIADKFHEDLLILVRFQTVKSNNESNKETVQVSFVCLFLGGVDSLLNLMQKSFPELGLKREDCTEMSWIESVLFFAGFPSGVSRDVLLNRTTQSRLSPFKVKSDYVKEPIPENVLEEMWEILHEEEVGMAVIQLFPYGGRMSEISESEIPFPHRVANLFKILYLVTWEGEGNASERHIDWIRKLYSYMTPYVSKNPRAAYLNYRDLDIGTNRKNGTTSYAEASVWGTKYFANNFKRLVHVKTIVDPVNFFTNEQSIPPFQL